MSTRQVDDLAKKLATGASRRGVFRGLAGLALGATGVVVAGKAVGADDDDRCNRPGERRCFKKCRRRGGRRGACRERCCDD